MRNAFLVVAVAIACASPPQASAQEKWSVWPGEVKKLDKLQYVDRKARVTGTFSFEADNALGIESNKLGGACLVADLTAQDIGKKQCAKDADCNPVVRVQQRPGRPDVPGVTSFPYSGYCLPAVDRPNSPKVCWVRPGSQPDYCLTSLQLKGPLEVKQYTLPVVRQDPTGKGLPVRWRILSCLNPPTPVPTPEGYRQPCSDIESSNKQTHEGPIRR